MTETILTGLLWFSAIGCGLIAGVYFAFSAGIMTSFGRIDRGAGIAALNAINADFLKSSFMPIFIGTTLASVILTATALFRLGEPGTFPMLAGGVIYIIGMFGVTMIFHVPLNYALAAVNPSSAETAPFWASFLKDWTFWNHVRTLASAVGSVLFTLAIVSNRPI